MDVQAARLMEGRSFLNPVVGVQKGLETHKPFNIAAFKHKEVSVCLEKISLFLPEKAL